MFDKSYFRRLLPLAGVAGLLATLAVRGQDEGDEAAGRPAGAGPIRAGATAAGSAAQAVVPGYFLFPIGPGTPGYLAASMGELRPNHFHGGLDIKTGGGVNKPVYAAADGYVSRLKQSSFGYGNVLYITHPNGLTTVYGHLNRFEGPVAQELLRQQYAQQTYELELRFEPGRFPVRRGEEVALSGNTGGSVGPHLHWEVRDAQDRQLNPLQWGGFAEVQDHVAPTLLALAVEPLGIASRVRGQFARVLWTPPAPLPGGPGPTWPDTVTCTGQVGLLLQGFDRFDHAWNKNGIQRVAVQVNGQPFYQHVIDAVPFPNGSRQVNNFVDYSAQLSTGRLLQKLWVDEGNDLGFYTPAGAGRGVLTVEPGQVYRIDIELADSYNNRSAAHLTLRGEAARDYVALPGKAIPTAPPRLRYDISRNILRAVVTAPRPDSGTAPPNLVLRRGRRELALRPSYSVGSETTYLYDLRAGLPDSLVFGPVAKAFDRQVLVAAGQEMSYTTPYLSVAFGPQTLFQNLYLGTSHRPATAAAPETWSIGTPQVPLYLPVRVSLRPTSRPADLRRTAVYAITPAGGRAYVGGTWGDDSASIGFVSKTFGTYRLYTDTKAPEARLLGRAGGQFTFRVGDDLSGLSSYRLLVGGRFRLLRYEHKNNTLFTVAGDTLGPALRGPAQLQLTDQAGNERIIPLQL